MGSQRGPKEIEAEGLQLRMHILECELLAAGMGPGVRVPEQNDATRDLLLAQENCRHLGCRLHHH